MIKRIIFDIDDTLIKFPVEFKEMYESIIRENKLDISYKDLFKAIDKYEECKKYTYYNKKDLIDVINKSLNLNLDVTFLNSFLKKYNKLITPVPIDTIETLKYLKSKYELVILSNWFTDSQISRLKCAGIYEFFNQVFCADKIPMKPYKEAFIKACGDHNLNECVMVGDSLKSDIEVPYSLGMNAYYLTNKESKYPSIKKISDLKELL